MALFFIDLVAEKIFKIKKKKKCLKLELEFKKKSSTAIK